MAASALELRATALAVDLRDAWRRRRTVDPPALLRHRVHGSLDLDDFRAVGERCAADVEHALAGVGTSLRDVGTLLDFGCGCGRVLPWLARRAPTARLHGTDTDASAVRWCRRHLPFARFVQARELPPLPYADATFDVVVGISVFTHLDEAHQRAWLAELARVMVPGGVVVLSLHGRHVWQHLPAAERSVVETDGLLFLRSHDWAASFPSWYQTAFHTRELATGVCGERFDVLAYLERGLNAHHDLIVLGARGAGG